MKKYETPVVEVVAFEEEIMLANLFGAPEVSRIEDGGEWE